MYVERYKGRIKKLSPGQLISLAATVLMVVTIPLAVFIALNPKSPQKSRANPITPPVTPPTELEGDINSDGVVNILDYTLLSNAFGTSNVDADINNDGTVNILDYTILSNNFGFTSP